MFAFSASVDKPDICTISICVHPETAAVDKRLLFPAASASMIDRDRRKLTFHAALPTPSFGEGFFEYRRSLLSGLSLLVPCRNILNNRGFGFFFFGFAPPFIAVSHLSNWIPRPGPPRAQSTTSYSVKPRRPINDLEKIIRKWYNKLICFMHMKEATRFALDFIRTFPCGEADHCRLFCDPETETVRNLYRSFGFEEAPEMPEGRDGIPAVLNLSH